MQPTGQVTCAAPGFAIDRADWAVNRVRKLAGKWWAVLLRANPARPEVQGAGRRRSYAPQQFTLSRKAHVEVRGRRGPKRKNQVPFLRSGSSSIGGGNIRASVWPAVRSGNVTGIPRFADVGSPSSMPSKIRQHKTSATKSFCRLDEASPKPGPPIGRTY
jgi:hypothetical protein